MAKKKPIIFVIGPACSGKSYFIKHMYPDAVVVDLLKYQMKYPVMCPETVLESYEDCKKALVRAAKNHPDKTIVLEHTMLRRERRKSYIDAVKAAADRDIICVCMMPDPEIYKKFCYIRNEVPDSLTWTIFEKPSESEGFSSIYTFKPEVKSEKGEK